MNWTALLSPKRAGVEYTDTRPDRSEFEKDFDRIIFSLPFRRLQDKTQVFPLPEDDFVHNRLTHSLEVASVGRSLGKLAGEQIIAKDSSLQKLVSASEFGAIVSAASLAHDVGNPPFGHSGESAISEFFKGDLGQHISSRVTDAEYADLINFEGNAQGFRLINQSLHGLKITFATLGAFTKYPRQSILQSTYPERVSQKKYGYYQSEKAIFTTVAEQLGLSPIENGQSWTRHPLAYLVEAADDICYHIIDLEDGCTLGLVSLDDTIDLLKPIIGTRFNQEKLNSKTTQHEKLGTLRALAINELISQSVAAFIKHEKGFLSGEQDSAITSMIDASESLAKIKTLSIDRIYRAQVVLEKEIAGFEVINGLLDVLAPAIFEYTNESESFRSKTILRAIAKEVTLFLRRDDLYGNLRVLLDYISGMTDTHALTLYRKFKGMSLPSW